MELSIQVKSEWCPHVKTPAFSVFITAALTSENSRELSRSADAFGLMCVHYDQPDGAPPPRERYRERRNSERRRLLAKRVNHLPIPQFAIVVST